MNLCRGKLPARPGAVSFKLGAYLGDSAPQPPSVFGQIFIPDSWEMLGNDNYGDCVWAGAAHETMKWGAEGGFKPAFTSAGVLSDYAACTGFSTGDPASDQGTDVATAMEYRRKTGIIDARGNRHKIDAYVDVPLDLNVIAQAAWLFGSVGIGLNLPASAEDQFEKGQPWNDIGGPARGGHYVPLIGRNSKGRFLVVTWGQLQAVEPGYFTAYMDEAICPLSLERITKGMSPEHFDLATLRRDLAALPTEKAA